MDLIVTGILALISMPGTGTRRPGRYVGRKRRHLPHGDRLRIAARGDPPDQHVAADGPLDLAVFPADPQRPHPELAHQVTRLAQGLSRIDVRHIRFRGLTRAGHRDPLLSLSKPTAPLAIPVRHPSWSRATQRSRSKVFTRTHK